ncbi:MAG: hypothetical protein KKH91_05155 [Elusimicrobia bacterium]|nr:hypothetical protein [Elusimicrobiota bacterium]
MITNNWRKYFLGFGVIATIYCLISFSLNGLTEHKSEFNVLYGVVLSITAFIAMYICCQGKRVYYSPITFAMHFIIGFPLALTFVLEDENSGFAHKYGQYGFFGFTNAEYVNVVLVAIVGIAGIVFGQLIAKSLVNKNFKITETYFKLSENKLLFLIILWFALSIILSTLMWNLGVGQLGLVRIDPLPFRLTGIMNYTRYIIVPVTSIILLSLTLKYQKTTNLKILLLLIFTEGLYSGIEALSRAALFFRLIPVILYVFMTIQTNATKRLVSKYLIFGSLLLLFLLPLTTVLRDMAYEKGSYKISEVVEKKDKLHTGGFLNIKEVVSFAVMRIGGVTELMAVSASPLNDLESFYGSMAQKIDFNKIVYGLDLTNGPGFAMGWGVSFFGYLFTSGSTLIVFLSSAFISAFLVWLEFKFYKIDAPEVNAVVGFMLAHFCWEGVINHVIFSLSVVVFIYLLLSYKYHLRETKLNV